MHEQLDNELTSHGAENFENVIAVLMERLTSESYVKYLSFTLREEENVADAEIVEKYEAAFKAHLPVDMRDVFIKLRSNLDKINYIGYPEKTISYITAMLHCCSKNSVETYIYEMMRFTIYFAAVHITSLVKDVPQYQKVFGNILKIGFTYAERNKNMPMLVLKDLVCLLKMRKLAKEDVDDVAGFLSKIVLTEPHVDLYKSFEFMDPYEAQPHNIYYAYSGLYWLIFHCENDNTDTKHAVTAVFCCLLKYCKTGEKISHIMSNNMRVFFLRVTEFYRAKWVNVVFGCLGMNYSDSIEFSDLLNSLPITFYENLTYYLTAKASSEENPEKCMALIYLLILHIHPLMTDRKKNLFVSTFLQNLLCLLKREKCETGSIGFATKTFGELVNSNNRFIVVSLRKALVTPRGRATKGFKEVFAVLARRTDNKWRYKPMNTWFLNTMWQIYVKYRRIIIRPQKKVLEELVESASNADLREVVHILKIVIISTIEDEPNLSTFILKTLINHMLTPTVLANYYVQQVNDLTFGKIAGQEPANSYAIQLIEYILSPYIDYENVMKKLSSLNLLNHAMIDHLFTYTVRDHPNAWNIAFLILQRVHYENLIPYSMKAFFSNPTNQIFNSSSLQKILQCLLLMINAQPRILHEDFFNNTILPILKRGFEEKLYNGSTFVTPLRILKLVNNDDLTNVEWLKNLYSTWLTKLTDILLQNNAMELIYSANILNYCRELYLVANYEVPDDLIDHLQKTLDHRHLSKFYEFPELWSNLVTFYTKMACRKKISSKDCWKTVERSLKAGPSQVKINSLAAFHDICMCYNIEEEEYLLTLFHHLRVENQEEIVRFSCFEHLIEYFDKHENYVFEYVELYQIIRTLMEFSTSQKMLHFICEFKIKILGKFGQAYAKNFLQILLHFNECTNIVGMSPETLSDEIGFKLYSPDKKLFVYKVTMNSLTDYMRFNIVDQIATYIFTPVINGRNFGHCTGNVLNDCLNVVIVNAMISFDREIKSYEVGEFFNIVLREIKDEILEAPAAEKAPTIYDDFNDIIKNQLIALLKLLYKIDSVDRNLIQDTFFAVILVIKAYFDNVCTIVNENSQVLKPLLQRLDFYHIQHQHELHYIYNGINTDLWRNIY